MEKVYKIMDVRYRVVFDTPQTGDDIRDMDMEGPTRYVGACMDGERKLFGFDIWYRGSWQERVYFEAIELDFEDIVVISDLCNRVRLWVREVIKEGNPSYRMLMD